MYQDDPLLMHQLGNPYLCPLPQQGGKWGGFERVHAGVQSMRARIGVSMEMDRLVKSTDSMSIYFRHSTAKVESNLNNES